MRNLGDECKTKIKKELEKLELASLPDKCAQCLNAALGRNKKAIKPQSHTQRRYRRSYPLSFLCITRSQELEFFSNNVTDVIVSLLPSVA